MGTNHYVKIGKRGLIRAIKGGPYSNVMAQYGLFTPVSGSVYERARQQANYMMEHAGKRNGSRAPLTLHVGKSSCGWRFSLHYIPGLCETLRDWDAENGLLRHDDRITKSSPDGVTYDLIDDDSQSW